MPISRSSRVVGVGPDMDLAQFRTILQVAGSPAVPEAEAGYQEVVARGVSPAFALAIFRHESFYGQRGICADYGTKNPGNVRTPRTGIRLRPDPKTGALHPDPAGPVVRFQDGALGEVVDTPKGPFVRFPTWRHGWADLAERLVDPAFVYAQHGAVRIDQIIPIWAPASDGNSPENYIAAVVQAMTEWVSEMSNLSIPGLAVRVSHIPRDNRNRPGHPMTPQGITIHETANRNVGANAEMHRRFTHNGGGSEGVSFHWVVDSTEAIQLLPHTENAWHGGDGSQGRCNRTRIAIELCVNADGDWGKTLEHGARLVAHLCREYGWGVDRVEQHHACSGKNCPATLRQGGWEPWLRQVEQFLRGEEPRPHAIYFPETGHWIAHGFKAYWEAHGGLRVLGLPLTEEFRATDTGLVTQVFERYVLEWDPSAPPDWQVRGRHLRGLDLERIVPAEAWQPRPA